MALAVGKGDSTTPVTGTVNSGSVAPGWPAARRSQEEMGKLKLNTAKRNPTNRTPYSKPGQMGSRKTEPGEDQADQLCQPPAQAPTIQAGLGTQDIYPAD